MSSDDRACCLCDPVQGNENATAGPVARKRCEKHTDRETEDEQPHQALIQLCIFRLIDCELDLKQVRPDSNILANCPEWLIVDRDALSQRPLNPRRSKFQMPHRLRFVDERTVDISDTEHLAAPEQRRVFLEVVC